MKPQEEVKNMTLTEYVLSFTDRGECRCGKCIDKGSHELDKLSTHTVEVGFFDVCAVDFKGIPADKETLLQKISDQRGEFTTVNLFDGNEHGYIELGAWIGDQQVALRFMGLAKILDVVELLTPKKLLGGVLSDEVVNLLAQQGMVTVVRK
jgi:hypothetical protein